MFVHGALCYSFSGMCLFSSYLGGMGANRGLCTQPCRRKYIVDGFSGYFFNLKDNQLIREVPALVKMGVSTFKIEGRMRSAEYVYNTGRAYRLAIDHPERIEEAEELLRYDMGREKTSWFMGGNVSKSLADTSVTGIPAGKVSHTDEKHIYIIGSTINLSAGNRLWIISSDGQRRIALKIKDIEQTKDFTILSKPFDAEVFKDDSVYLANLRERQFQTKFNEEIPLVLPKTNTHKIPPVIFDSKPKKKFQE
ncbi:MAG: U32 family peptidase, partial [Bacteroidales bacterium]|nr:U32 family peptidase [Bacteroidales bacterium]